MTRFVLLLALVISNSAYCQVDPAKLDSLVKRIESTHRSTGAYQDSFMKAGDSTYRIAVGKPHAGDDTRMITEIKEERNGSRNYVRPGIAVLLLVLLVIGLLRFTKKSNQS